MKTISKTVLIALTALLIFSCKTNKEEKLDKNNDITIKEQAQTTKELPNTFPLKETALHPEGIVYGDATIKTYVGSYWYLSGIYLGFGIWKDRKIFWPDDI